ncbi:MAG: choice-of-anchor tandem repeat NxxGxxAF-containing protein [Acidobacteriota bacterium]
MWIPAALLLAALFASSSVRAQGRGPRGEKNPSSRALTDKDKAERKTLLQAWRQTRRTRASRGIQSAEVFGGSASIGRPSLEINDAGTVLYTKQFAGSACEPDPGAPSHWHPSTVYAANDVADPVTGGGGLDFRATNAGTSGATEPIWPLVFGATIVDGTITWQATDRNWTANRTLPVGAVVRPNVSTFGFNFQVTVAGTTGATQPAWPTTIGATVVDNTVTWKAIGYFPGSFRGCDPMQLVSRASGGVETVLATEGQLLGGAGAQMSGWAEFYALNNVGQAAFRTVVEGRLTDDDESGSGIFTAGPGAGTIAEVAASNTLVAGRFACGFNAMVGSNDAGQVLFDALISTTPTWTASTAYGAGVRAAPTVRTGIEFQVQVAGTSGAVEPVWPTTVGTTVVDGTVTWISIRGRCNEDAHGVTRFTSGTGNQLLMAVGTDVGGGTTVVGFGNDSFNFVTGICSGCAYENIDGFLNASGHASAAVRLSTGDTAAYLLTGPLTFTQVARTGGAGPGGAFGRIFPRTELNASDQVLFVAAVGGVNKMIRWTPPSTFTVVASVGDDIGTRSGGAASGVTITNLGFYGDINGPGNVAFQATTSTGPNAYYFWDGTTGLITEIAREGATFPATLASEMLTLNDSNVAAFTAGADTPESTEESSELDETAFFFWTKLGGATKLIQNGDVIGGLTVSSVNAQHPSFRQRQLNSAGCSAVQYFVGGVTGGATEDRDEGSGPSPYFPGVAPGGQLLVGCAGIVPVSPTPTLPAPTVTPTRTTTPGGGANGPGAAGVPTLSGGVLALFGIGLAAMALLLIRRRF